MIAGRNVERRGYSGRKRIPRRELRAWVLHFMCATTGVPRQDSTSKWVSCPAIYDQLFRSMIKILDESLPPDESNIDSVGFLFCEVTLKKKLLRRVKRLDVY